MITKAEPATWYTDIQKDKSMSKTIMIVDDEKRLVSLVESYLAHNMNTRIPIHKYRHLNFPNPILASEFLSTLGIHITNNKTRRTHSTIIAFTT